MVDAVRFVESMRPATRRQSRRQPVFSSYPLCIGKTDTAINKGTFASPVSGSVSVWSGNTSFGSLADTGTDITAYNFWGNVASGKQVLCLGFDLGWVIIAAECP
jgi:hypothetical protein